MPNKNKDFLNWEFWPFWFFYIPVYFFGAFLMIKARSATFFTLVNPIMKWGGLYAYSKSDILKYIDAKFRPKEIFVNTGHPIEKIEQLIVEHNLKFPIVIKPDKGERGTDVHFISDQNELKQIKLDSLNDYIIQEYINYPLEIGAFFIRNQSDGTGIISSLMERVLLKVKGDGVSTIRSLITSDSRKKRFINKIENNYPKLLEQIPLLDEEIIIEPIGNHNRGTIFLDQNSRIDEELQNNFNSLLRNLEGFNYGRLDIRAESWESLKSGKNYKVIEINGMNSEPAHIYQPGYSIFKAYKSIFWHWNEAFKISKISKAKGYKASKFSSAYKAYIKYLKSD